MDNSEQILKNLNAVLTYAKERYNNEFKVQEVRLNDEFKNAFSNFIEKRGTKIKFLNYTSIATNKTDQNIYIANQWFVIASYFVDFCTELLTYQSYFEAICEKLNKHKEERKNYANHLRTAPTPMDKQEFAKAAWFILKEQFPNREDEFEEVIGYLWKFVCDYKWWSGNKTIDRHDFYISAILNQLNVVNASAEYLAIIVLYYASDLKLRQLVEKVGNFTIAFKPKISNPTIAVVKSYQKAEKISINIEMKSTGSISISAASLNRFNSRI